MSELDLSRRSALGLGVGAVVAAVVPPAPAAATAAAPEAITATLTASTDPNWRWWAGTPGADNFSGPYNTRQEAIDVFFDDFVDVNEEPPVKIEVIEAHQDVSPEWAKVFDVDNLKSYFEEQISNQDTGELNPEENPWETVPVEDFNDLAERLNAAAKAWFVEREISKKMTVWCFQGQRNFEVITVGDEIGVMAAIADDYRLLAAAADQAGRLL